MKTITPLQLQNLIDKGEVELIDVRPDEDFKSVHALTARSIPLSQFEPQSVLAHRKLDKHAPLYVMCRRKTLASVAVCGLTGAGLDEAILVEGGLEAWEKECLPVVRKKSWQLQVTDVLRRLSKCWDRSRVEAEGRMARSEGGASPLVGCNDRATQPAALLPRAVDGWVDFGPESVRGCSLGRDRCGYRHCIIVSLALTLLAGSSFAAGLDKSRRHSEKANVSALTYANVVSHFKEAQLRVTEVQPRCSVFFEGEWKNRNIYDYALIIVENSDEDIQVTFYFTDAHEMNWVTEFLDAPFFTPTETSALFGLLQSSRDVRNKDIGRFRVDSHHWQPKHADIFVFSFTPTQQTK